MGRGLRDKAVATGRCPVGNSRAVTVLQELNDVRSVARLLNHYAPGSPRYTWAATKLAGYKARLDEAREIERTHLVDCAQCSNAELERIKA